MNYILYLLSKDEGSTIPTALPIQKDITVLHDSWAKLTLKPESL